MEIRERKYNKVLDVYMDEWEMYYKDKLKE